MSTMITGVLPPPRQIRFVHSQGQPPNKRRRISAACLTCRRRKTRCAGERPVCSTCTKNGHACLGYTEMVDKKRDAPTDFARATSADQDELRDMKDESEELLDRPRKTRRLLDSTALPSSSLQQAVPLGTRRKSDSFLHRPPGASLPRIVGFPKGHEHDERVTRDTGRSDLANSSSSNPVALGESRRTVSGSPVQNSPEPRRVPYFRYFGPTAIVPGFKQMVASVRDRRRSVGGSFSAASPNSGLLHASTSRMEGGGGNIDALPSYDPNNPAPVHPLILDLIQTFFSHLGCNYPFLEQSKFMRMAREKCVEPILVDAVCALAARFSDSRLFAEASGDENTPRSDFGRFYASRAKAATIDTFTCPTVGAVQACLLMAYEAFGASQDSALWMYLGISIRMAMDLGLQKEVGIKYQGEKDPWYTHPWKIEDNGGSGFDDGRPSAEDISREEQMEVEQGRIDTFWAVFTLDRVISSGTGRPVTFRDDDFELTLPEPFNDPESGWPDPRPHFIRIVHLYGRVSDVLNHVMNAEDLTQERWTKLARMENELTNQYQNMDSRLAFNVGNFNFYVKAGQGTTFILLHLWFHALIIVLHQPALLTPFSGLCRTHQLLPNSRELSMSSAKTIADILAFAELTDPKSLVGNPFTSQPIYIAACAFLMESSTNSSLPVSREGSPPRQTEKDELRRPSTSRAPDASAPGAARDGTKSTKHTLLASAANQNYQRCYNSLRSLHQYWGGVKYILTALDQKAKGIWDCETYTLEEYESTRAVRKGSISRLNRFENPATPSASPIAWSLTGTTDSPSSNLTLMYQQMNRSNAAASNLGGQKAPVTVTTPPPNPLFDSTMRQNLPVTPSMFRPVHHQATASTSRQSPRPVRPHRLSTSSLPGMPTAARSMRKFEDLPMDDVITPPPSVEQTAKMQRMGPPPHQAFTPSPQHSSAYEPSIMPRTSPVSTVAETPRQQSASQLHPHHPHHHLGQSIEHSSNTSGYGNGGGGGEGRFQQQQQQLTGESMFYLSNMGGPMGDGITFNSQEIDIGSLMPNEMMPQWLEYLPTMGSFDGNTMGPDG